MKRLLMAVIFLFGSTAYAVETVTSKSGRPESAYSVAHSTVSISSFTVSSDAASVGYRSIWLNNLSTSATIYYRIDGSTNYITTVGWPIYPGEQGNIEYNGVINYLLGAGSAATTFIKKVIRK